MAANNLGQSRLRRIDVEGGRVAHCVTERIEAADIEARKVGGVGEEGRSRRRKTKRGRVELSLVLPHILLDKAREADARVEDGRRPQVVDMVERAAVIDAEEKVTRRTDAV